MTGIIIVALFLFALHRFGRLGPFAWQGREHLAAARTAGRMTSTTGMPAPSS